MTLRITPEKKILVWKSKVEDMLNQGIDIYVVGDTETTGGVGKSKNISVIEKEDQNYLGKTHRVLEVGFILCTKDESGYLNPIYDDEKQIISFHEYVNPFNESEEKRKKINCIDSIPYGAYNVHGISKDFLFGNATVDQGNNKKFKLSGSAPTFQEIIEPLSHVLGINNEYRDEKTGSIYAIFHNYEFDAKFMNFEYANCMKGVEPYLAFEAYVKPKDTLLVFRNLFTNEIITSLKKKIEEEKGVKIKGLFALDTLVQIFTNLDLLKQDNVDRTLHGALKDTKILLNLYNAVVSSEYYPKAEILDDKFKIQECLKNIIKNSKVATINKNKIKYKKA